MDLRRKGQEGARPACAGSRTMLHLFGRRRVSSYYAKAGPLGGPLREDYQMSVPIVVRPMTGADRLSVVEIMRQSDLELSWDSFLVERAEELGVIFVAAEGAEMVGLLHGKFDGDYSEHLAGGLDFPQAWIHWIVVEEGARRTGVASALVSAFARAAQLAGCTFIACLVEDSAGFWGRLSFFESLGMTSLSGEDPQAVGAPISTVLK